MENLIANDKEELIEKHRPGGYHQIWSLSYPVVLTMISQTLIGLFGTMMVGKINTAQLGAAGLGSIVGWAFLSFFNGIISTASTFVAQDYGAKQYNNIGRTAWHYIYIAIASYLIMLVFGTASNLILGFIGSSPEVQAYSITYIRIQLYSGIGVFISFALIGFFRGIGNTKTPMYITIAVSIFNVFACYLLIFGKFGFPRLEVIGMAMANGISSVLSAIIYIVIYLSKRNHKLYQTRVYYRIDLNYIRRLIRIGLPAGIQFFLDTASFSIFTSFIARMGNVPLAASNAVMTFMNASFMPLFGISVSATTLVGQFMGAKEVEHARKSGFTTIKLGSASGTLMAIIFFIFSKQLISLISHDPDVIDLGSKILMLMSITRATEGVGVCSGGALRGAGDTKFPMFVGLVSAWTVFVPLSYLLGYTFKLGPIGAWIGTLSYILLYDTMVFARFVKGKWQSIRI